MPPHRPDMKRRRRVRLTKQATGPELRARRELNDVLRKLEPRLAVAFGRAARVILDQPNLISRLTEAIEAGDLTGAEEVVGAQNLAGALRGEGLKPDIPTFEQEVTAALAAGGEAGQRQMGPELARVMGSLDLTNPEAVAFLNSTLPTMIRETTQESVEAVRNALLRGFQEGRPARQIAREVRDSIGLTRAQATAVGNFRRQLETGQRFGSPVDTRRLSAAEQARAGSLFRAAQAGNPASQSQINAITSRYHESLLNRRSRNIARTEVTRAFGEGQEELWRQAVNRGLLDPEKTRRLWLVTPDERLREEHAAVPPMNPRGVGLNEPFQTPVGPVQAPRTSGIASFDINCRCTVVLEIDE